MFSILFPISNCIYFVEDGIRGKIFCTCLSHLRKKKRVPFCEAYSKNVQFCQSYPKKVQWCESYSKKKSSFFFESSILWVFFLSIFWKNVFLISNKAQFSESYEKVQFFESYSKKVQFFEFFFSKKKSIYWDIWKKVFNSLSHIQKKVFNSWSNIEKKGSILRVILKRRVQFCESFFQKEKFNSWSHIQQKKSISLGHIEKKFSSLSHI